MQKKNIGLSLSKHPVSRILSPLDTTLVIVRPSLEAFQRVVDGCETTSARNLVHGELDVEDLYICFASRFYPFLGHTAHAIATELSKNTTGPRSIVLNCVGSAPCPYYFNVFRPLQDALSGRSVTLCFRHCDSLLIPESCPNRRDLFAPLGIKLKGSRSMGLSLRSLAYHLKALESVTPRVGCVLDCGSLNLRKSWSCPVRFKFADLSDFTATFSVLDIISSLQRWGTFLDSCDDSLVRRLVGFSGPPAICETLIKHVDLEHVSSFSELARNFDRIRSSIVNDLKGSLPGLKYLTRSMCVFCLLVQNCTFESDPTYWFSECLMRLVKGGLLSLRLDKARGRYFIEPFYPHLVEKISQCMGVPVEFLSKGIMSTTAVRNSSHLYEHLILFEVLKLSSGDFWQKMNRLGLESLFTTIPELKRVMVIDMKSRLWITTMKSNTLYIKESGGSGFRELGFNAVYKGQLLPVVLALSENRGAKQRMPRGLRRPEYRLSLEQQGFATWVNISVALPAEEIDSIHLHESACDSSEPVFDHVLNLLRVKLPWWDISRRYRDYNFYMTRKLEMDNVGARMAMRQHKATPLTYSTTATETNARSLGLSVREFALFKKQSEIYRTKVGLPHIGSIQSVRLLVRHLVMWGVQLTEVIETRKFLKRRRIFWLAGRSIQPETLQESCLALGTRMTIMAILDAVQRAAVIA